MGIMRRYSQDACTTRTNQTHMRVHGIRLKKVPLVRNDSK